MNLQKLKEIINEKGFKFDFIAKKLNITSETFSRKMNGKNEFKISEVKTLNELLNLNELEYKNIFLKDGCTLNQHNPTPKTTVNSITLSSQEDEMTDQEAMDYLFGRKKG